jgi:hypothetical protein
VSKRHTLEKLILLGFVLLGLAMTTNTTLKLTVNGTHSSPPAIVGMAKPTCRSKHSRKPD